MISGEGYSPLPTCILIIVSESNKIEMCQFVPVLIQINIARGC